MQLPYQLLENIYIFFVIFSYKNISSKAITPQLYYNHHEFKNILLLRHFHNRVCIVSILIINKMHPLFQCLTLEFGIIKIKYLLTI